MDLLYKNTSAFFKALAHPTRVKILNFLISQGEICVCHIYEALELEQSNVSQHLKILRDNGILSTRKEGLKVHYSIKEKGIIEIINLTNNIITAQVNDQIKLIEQSYK